MQTELIVSLSVMQCLPKYVPDVGEVQEEQGAVLIPDRLHHREGDVQAARETGSLVLPSMPGRGEIQAPTQREEGEEGEEGRRGGGEEGRRGGDHCMSCARIVQQC